ncbi:hypothetical protein HELRODRAFT_158738 [Helobdella robusta]|uniref:Uncharacterized protein n=1 Tax=Helobdella robusta TaxID=6412 RepID=T1EN66_HELRO|nr:hypothetical protein HELRODRAFT_158738 [Helobdella robusta]ESO12260.1 hypothetical protein HELRODRAFT_158738 [Helobdella robusta]
MTTPNGNIKTEEQKNGSKPKKQHKNIFYKFFLKKKSQKVTNSCKETKESPSCNFCESLTCVTQSKNKNYNIDTNIEVSIGDESSDLQQSTNTLKKANNLFFESSSCHNLDSTEQSTLPLRDDSFQHEGNISFKIASPVEPIK